MWRSGDRGLAFGILGLVVGGAIRVRVLALKYYLLFFAGLGILDL